MRIALVHDWLTNMGGAERVLLALAELYPEAPIYTSVYVPASIPRFQGRDIRTSFLQQVPFARTHHQLFPTLRPVAFESFDFADYDVVISSASAEAKGIITKPDTCHISYCHTPTRYYWSDYHAYLNRLQFGILNPLIRWRMPRITKKMRLWDFAAAQRVDTFIANSDNTADRIRKYYHRESSVIRPPVDTDTIIPTGNKDEGFFLVVSRLVPYKRVDIVVEAFNQLKQPLKIVGNGPELSRLQALNTNPHAEFLTSVSETEKAAYFQNCTAFIFPTEDDAGITPLEAMAAGRPVIAYGSGGARETVIAGTTGTFFALQSPMALADTLKEFNPESYDSAVIRTHAEQFSKKKFQEKMKKFVEETHERYRTVIGDR